ncbi:unnamed protein product, partial [Soboliphyme baturini]|uniref:TNFR-Cys domain-containing protein n=1 Tax=Soboliphyme baturini TaxID=241478 RepID=A0A183IK61_9BILA
MPSRLICSAAYREIMQPILSRARLLPTVRACDPCLPGWGVLQSCNETHATVCQPCAVGTWSPNHPHLKQCRLCSRCGPGLYEDYACTSTRDTKCDSCLNSKGRVNSDYYRKCGDQEEPNIKDISYGPADSLNIDDSLITDNSESAEILDDSDNDNDNEYQLDTRDAAWRDFNRNFFHPHSEADKTQKVEDNFNEYYERNRLRSLKFKADSSAVS